MLFRSAQSMSKAGYSYDNAPMERYFNTLKIFSGMAGMYILKTESREEAEELCKREPLVVGGYAKYKLVGLQVANRENNYLL